MASFEIKQASHDELGNPYGCRDCALDDSVPSREAVVIGVTTYDDGIVIVTPYCGNHAEILDLDEINNELNEEESEDV